MKKIINYSGIVGRVLISALFFLSVSCNKDTVENNPNADSNSQLIKVSGEDANAATKTTLELLATKWKAGDKVGVYCAQSIGGTVNVPYTTSSAAFVSTFTGAMVWGTGTHNFYAYYPYSASAGADATAVPISLDAAQTQSAGNSSAHIGSYDFMVATPVTDTPSLVDAGYPTTVNLRYNHVFSILEFQIINATGTISEIKLSGNGPLSLTSGTIDITQATPANASTTYTILSPVYGSEITLTTTDAVTTTADYGTTPKIYMMVLPKSITGYLNIAIKMGGTYKFIQKVVPTGGFDRGQKFKVQIDAATATDYPGTTLALVQIPDMYSRFWAPVNAGYDPDHKYGLMYQWGRKYGQNYFGEGTANDVVGPVTFSEGNNLANAANFYKSAVTPYDWCNPQQETSWDMTLYNPCPAGWHLPTAAELTALKEAGSTWVASGGPDALSGRWFGGNHSGDHGGSIFLPASGMRSNDGATNRISYGHYWSSEVSGAKASALSFDISPSSPATAANERFYGFSARCVR